MTLFVILAALAAAALLTSYICFRLVFYAKPRKPVSPDHIDIPDGEIYEVFREAMENWVREARALNPQEFSVTSFDGLTLYGKFYEYAPGAPMELMFHGYRGNAERDLAGGVQRCFQAGRSAFIVDQRCSGKSSGNVITFGINEHRDCLTWVDFLCRHFGPDVKIILTGISMGASTVLMAGGYELPDNVIGILADCGFTSAKDIIRTVMKQVKLPAGLVYPFVKLGARIFGHFDLEELSAIDAVTRFTLPVIFYHGETDDFVPCRMSRELYDACVSRRKLVTIPGAGHGLSYPVAPEFYVNELREFFGKEASYD